MSLKERLRDKTRDKLTQALNALGIRAEMAERGRPEESVNNSWYQRSLGVIDLPDGPVRWINVLKKDGSQYSAPQWWYILFIPDERSIPSELPVEIKTVQRKTFPLFGKVVDVTWTGEDQGTGLANTLTLEPAAKDLAKRAGGMEVRSYTELSQGWTLQLGRRFAPRRRDWDAVVRIADHLLASPRAFWPISS